MYFEYEADEFLRWFQGGFRGKQLPVTEPKTPQKTVATSHSPSHMVQPVRPVRLGMRHLQPLEYEYMDART